MADCVTFGSVALRVMFAGVKDIRNRWRSKEITTVARETRVLVNSPSDREIMDQIKVEIVKRH